MISDDSPDGITVTYSGFDLKDDSMLIETHPEVEQYRNSIHLRAVFAVEVTAVVEYC